MVNYKMKESEFETPPENVYFIDLAGIDLKDGSKGPYLRWRWVLADLPGQEKYKGAYATSLTPTTPTLNNRFGHFIKVLLGGAELGIEGDTEALIDAKIRVKGFIEHNKGQSNSGEEVIYCNVKKLLEGSVQAGVGCGRQDLDESGKTIKQEASATPPPAMASAGVQPQGTPPPASGGSIPW